MRIFHFLGAIAGPKGFFGPGFFADFKEGWVSSANARNPRKGRKTPPSKVSCDTTPDGYVSVWKNLRPDDIWDFPEDDHDPVTRDTDLTPDDIWDLPDDDHDPVTRDTGLTPDDIWDFPDDNRQSDAAEPVAGIASPDTAIQYPEKENPRPDTACLFADIFIQRSYR